MRNSPQTPQPMTIQHQRIRGIAIWFYIIAGFQVVAAVMTWMNGSSDPDLATGAAVLAVLDLVIGGWFVVFGYFAAKRQPWAFVAGLILYGLRAVLQFFALMNPISIIIRAFLMFRIWQGLQACLQANNAEKAMTLLDQRRIVMPQSSPSVPAVSEPAAPAPAWIPPRGMQAAPQEAE